jgi:hypothetical protein
MPIFQDLIPAANSSQKWHVNMSQILNGHGAMDILNTRRSETYVDQDYSCVMQPRIRLCGSSLLFTLR